MLSRLEDLGDFPRRLLLFQGFALIVGLLALAQTNLQFDPALFKIDAGRDDRKPTLVNFADQFKNLGVMEQELAHPRRVRGIFPAALLIGTDVHVVDEDLAVLDPAEGLLKADLAEPQRLHLGAGQDQAGFKDIVDKIVVVRLFITGDKFDAHISTIRTKGFREG